MKQSNNVAAARRQEEPGEWLGCISFDECVLQVESFFLRKLPES